MALALLALAGPVAAEQSFRPGAVWLDTSGHVIQAHGGCIVAVHGRYYWYGTDMTYGPWNRVGVTCYSSHDLLNWKYEGVALPRDAVPDAFRDHGVCERPKVLFNARTGKYVMWVHLDNGTDYSVAMAGVAVAEKPTGPFRFVSAFRPIHFDFQYPPNDRDHQKELGSDFRDHTLFLDDDGQAYVFYAAESNATMYVSRLNPEFTNVAKPIVEGKTWARILVGRKRESPDVFKWQGCYFLITSACSGWAHNAAAYAVAKNPLGPWAEKGNPCVGPEADKSFSSQCAYVIPAPEAPAGSYIWMGDRWFKDRLDDSRHVWLPFRLAADATFELRWVDEWNLSWFAGQTAAGGRAAK